MFRFHNPSHKLCPSFLVAVAIFSAFTLTGIVSAAWVDAPNAPPNYGISGCTYPCKQQDFQPMNLSGADQIKVGSISASGFFDTDNPLYFLDPAAATFAANLSGHTVINGTAITPGAQLVVNNPKTAGKIGAAGDTIYSYNNSTNAAVSAEQGNPAGYGIYASGGQNYFQGNVGIGTPTPTQALDVTGNATISGNVGVGTTNPTTKLDVAGQIHSSAVAGVTTGGYVFPDNTVQTTAAGPRGRPLYTPNISCAEPQGSITTNTTCTGYTVIGYCGNLCVDPFCWPGGKDGWRYVTGTCSNTFIGYAVAP